VAGTNWRLGGLEFGGLDSNIYGSIRNIFMSLGSASYMENSMEPCLWNLCWSRLLNSQGGDMCFITMVFHDCMDS